MNQRYQFFILHWKRYLSDYENIFSSVNIYSIIKYLKEYWNSNRGRDLTSFEKNLVDRLVVIMENQGPDIKIIEKLDTDVTESLGKETKSLKQKKKLDDNSIKIIDHVISYCHSEQFKREIFLILLKDV